MIEETFFEYATRYLLVPGRRIQAHELIESIGLSEALPKDIQAMFHLSDTLGIDALVLTDSDPLLKQWNPFSGRWSLCTEGAFGVQLLNDHRWLQKMHEAGSKALHHALHEITHSLWAVWGQCGLLSLLSKQEQLRFHLAAEACAVLMSDLEGHAHLLDSGLLDRYWPASRSKCHAVGFSPIEALKATGLDSETRAQWLFSIYLDHQRSLPTLPTHPGHRVEALAFLIEEANYADKAELMVTPSWLRSYWGRPEIEDYLRDFVPPHPLKFPYMKAEISTVDACIEHWRALTLGASALSVKERAYLKARLSIQRVALKICELQGVFESYRLVLNEPERAQAKHLLFQQRQEVLELFTQRYFSPLGRMNEEDAQDSVDVHHRLLKQLEARLIDLCGSTLSLTHPHLDRLAYAEHTPLLTLSTKERSENHTVREMSELVGALHLVKSESKSFLLCHKEEPNVSHQILAQAERRYLEASMHLMQLEIKDPQTLRLDIETWLMELQKTRELWLAYPLKLMSVCPFVDPLIGFRFQ